MSAMLFLASALLATTAPQPHAAAATVQATATIRIITAVQLKLDGSSNPGAPPLRDSVVKAPDGTFSQAKLIEFQ